MTFPNPRAPLPIIPAAPPAAAPPPATARAAGGGAGGGGSPAGAPAPGTRLRTPVATFMSGRKPAAVAV